MRPLASYKLNKKLKLLGGITIEKAIKSENQIRYSTQDASFQNQNQNLTYGEAFLRYSLNLGISYKFSFKLFKKQFTLIPRFMLQHALNDSYEKNGQSIRGSSIHLSTGVLF